MTSTSMRTHHCGELRPTHVGSTVSVCGWVARRREHGEHLAFVDLRDHTGIVQCVVDGAADLRSEYVVRVTGTVRPRPEGTVNPSLATGEVEMGDCKVEILVGRPSRRRSRSTTAPTTSTRRSACATATSTCAATRCSATCAPRAAINRAIRAAMERAGLRRDRDPDAHRVDPGGRPRLRGAVAAEARERSTPCPRARSCSSSCCMVGGIDRYYQIARCLRDEDLRADRQFEFTQLDAEMSFVDPGRRPRGHLRRGRSRPSRP